MTATQAQSSNLDFCIQACLNCLKDCENCATACSNSDMVQKMSECIKLCRDCTDTCALCARFLMRQSGIHAQVYGINAEACEPKATRSVIAVLLSVAKTITTIANAARNLVVVVPKRVVRWQQHKIKIANNCWATK
ncbi:four-helix bundle copper-binding protein [Myxosarcina sp. GI1(2024)]